LPVGKENLLRTTPLKRVSDPIDHLTRIRKGFNNEYEYIFAIAVLLVIGLMGLFYVVYPFDKDLK
jgi:hypothetical protein